MIDLNPYVDPPVRKKIGSLSMSDTAAAELTKTLADAKVTGELVTPKGFGPLVAETVAQFVGSAYFRRNRWMREQTVHLTTVVSINTDPPVVPIFHLQKTPDGYSVVSPTEIAIPEDYCEKRVIEEVKVELGMES